MRILAVVAALAVAAAQLAAFVVAERARLPELELAGVVGTSAAMRWTLAVAWSLPWLVGAVLLVVGRVRIGAAVLVTLTALVLPAGLLPAVDAVRTWVDGGAPAVTLASLATITRFVGALVAAVAVLAVRPGPGWRAGAPGPRGGYVTVAVLAWLPSTFRTTAYAPPGAPRRFIETGFADLDTAQVAAAVAAGVVAAAVLWAAPRLRPAVAGAVALTYAVPTLVAEVAALLQVRTVPDLIATPPGVLGAVGLVGVTVVGLRWAWSGTRRSDRRAGP